MDKKLGDWEIEKDLLAICVIASSGIPIKEKGLYNEIVKVILADRKHQKSEMLKRLPSVGEIKKELSGERISGINELAQTILVTAIHDFIEDKLK